MERGERFETLGPLGSQVQMDDPVVGLAAITLHEPGGLCPVGELDGAVVAKREIVRDLTDRRPPRVCMPADREEELVVGGGEARSTGLLCAPALKMAQPGPEGK